jgi:hypothetical protein
MVDGLPLTLTGKRSATLRLSEIAFDKGPRYAALHYFFSCGNRCAESSIAVFEKSEGTWRQIDRHCATAFA